VARIFAAFLIASAFYGLGPAVFAQDGRELAAPDPALGASKHAKKNSHKNGGATQQTAAPRSEDAEKAARLAEGRKKFFERSMGFDNGSSGPVTLGGENGLTPSMGLKF
jgi:hypothetical protein